MRLNRATLLPHRISTCSADMGNVGTRREEYQPLGSNYYDESERNAVQRRLVRRLEALSLEVSLQPAALPA